MLVCNCRLSQPPVCCVCILVRTHRLCCALPHEPDALFAREAVIWPAVSQSPDSLHPRFPSGELFGVP